jgi:filamentous hemagglutinin family protein
MVALPGVALAQTTAITPDVGGALGLGTTAIQSGKIVTIDGGTLAGGNLFHSFTQFSLGAGDTAMWVRSGGGAAGITNVINRVTGGQVSQIAGTLDSTAFPNAGFFFINPAGIVFGAGAQVNVPAAAYFSTAGELRFAGGGRFAVATPNGSTLSVAAPESFGFVGGQGAIAVNGVGPGFAPAHATLSLIASDITLDGAQIALGGLDLAAVGTGQGVVALADPLATAQVGSLTVRNSLIAVTPGAAVVSGLRLGGGAVVLDGANLASFTDTALRGGDIRIAAGQLRFINGSIAGASTRSVGAGGDVVIRAGAFQGENSSLYTLTATDGRAGRLSLSADSIDLTGVTLSSNASGSGRGGDITVQANALTADSAYLITQSYGTGSGGDIAINAPQMKLGGSLAFAGSSASGTPGNVVLRGDLISLNGGSYGSSPGLGSPSGNLTVTADTSLEAFGTFFAAVAATDNSVGTISISSPRIYFSQVFLNSESDGAGAAGVLSIQGKSLTLDRSQIHAVSKGVFVRQLGLVQLTGTDDLLINNSLLDSTSEGQAQGGTISIEGGKVTLNEDLITANSNGAGRGGQVFVKADALQVSNSQLTSKSVVAGDAGDVMLDARLITLDTAAEVSSETLSLDGNAGSVTIKGGEVVLEDAKISSKTSGGNGHAGTVTVHSDSLSLTDSTISSDTEGLGDAGSVVIHTGHLQVLGNNRAFTSITSDTFSDGDAGGVTIVAKTMVVRDQGYISSDTFGYGNAGAVSIDAGSLKVLNGSHLSSDSWRNGNAGDISIRADSLTIDSSDSSRQTYISSDSLEGGDAGNVTINASTLSVVHGGFISSNTYSGGDAGDLLITAGTMTVQHNAAIASVAYPGSAGNAGFISIAADTLTVRDNSVVSTSSAGDGDAGSVILKAKTLTIDNSEVSSAAVVGATGASGLLSINAQAVSVVNGGIISTVSNNPRPAGQIDLTAESLAVDGEGSAVSSENQAGNTALGNPAGESGAAGTIHLASNRITIANGARASTNAFAGAAGDIEIAMPAGSVLTLKGADAPGTIQTSSGVGTGGRITIASPLAIASNGGSILALGQQRGANVAIRAKYFINSSDRLNTVAVDGEFHLVAGLYDVSAGTVSRDLSVLDASKVLRGQCPVARATGQVSQLVTRQVGPYVLEPSFEVSKKPLDSVQLDVGACR